MRDRLHILAITAVIFVFLSGCATTSETDPAKVSMGDLLFGKKRLDNHLDTRRADLDRLMDQSASLSLRLNGREQTLRRINEDYEQEAKTSRKLDAEQSQLRVEASQRQNELNQAQDRLDSLNDELKLLREKASTGRADQDELQRQIAENENQISSLEKEVGVLERAIDRIITVRARHALETS